MIDLEKQERLFDLLADRALFELAADEERELEGLLEIFPEYREDDSFSLTAAAITLAGLETREEMPESLKGRIVSNASEYFEAVEEEAARPALTEARSNVIEFKPRRSNWNWLGWAAAAAACIALAINIWMTRGASGAGDCTRSPGDRRKADNAPDEAKADGHLSRHDQSDLDGRECA